MNARAWLRWDRRQRIKADNDLHDARSCAAARSDYASRFRARHCRGPAMPDSLAERAVQADAHWVSRSEIFAAEPNAPTSLRGMYRYIYRRDSQHTHSAVASIEPLILGSPPGSFHVIALEVDAGRFNAYTMAPIVLTLALVAGGTALGLTEIEPDVERGLREVLVTLAVSECPPSLPLASTREQSSRARTQSVVGKSTVGRDASGLRVGGGRDVQAGAQGTVVRGVLQVRGTYSARRLGRRPSAARSAPGERGCFWNGGRSVATGGRAGRRVRMRR